MRRNSIYLYAVTLIMTVVAISCKKNETETIYNTMIGSVEYELPAYTVRGQYVELDVSGIVSPSDVSWLWVSKSLHISDNDSVVGSHLSFVVPNVLGEDTLVAYAKKDGYYSSSRTKYTQVFDPTLGGESIDGIHPGDYFFVDLRDGESYPVVKYGRLDWFTMNLRYAGEDNSLGVAYEHSDETDVFFGRLYSWNEATGGKVGTGLGGGPQGACPEGWSVPTEEDWTDFANAVKPASVIDSLVFDDGWDDVAPGISAAVTINGQRMWEYSPDNVQTNSFRWNAIPTGKSSNAHVNFEQILKYGFWWVSSLTSDGRRAYFRYIYWDYPDMSLSTADKDNIGFSVRCVRLSN